MGYILWGCKESDMTEQLTHTTQAASPEELDVGELASVGQTIRLQLVPSQEEMQSCVGPEAMQHISGLLLSPGTQVPAFSFF